MRGSILFEFFYLSICGSFYFALGDERGLSADPPRPSSACACGRAKNNFRRIPDAFVNLIYYNDLQNK